MGITPDRLSPQQKELLRSSLHLKLLSSISHEMLAFATTRELFDAYWDQKRRDCDERRRRPVKFSGVISVIANAMSNGQRLSVPKSVVDEDDLASDAEIMASEGVLVSDGPRLAFFHESFFDYCFARQWTGRGETLLQFLLAGEQELFRRAQVRQILTHLREENSERFITEMGTLLSEPRVRFHIKDVTLAVLRALQEPTSSEWQMVERLIDSNPAFADRLWLALRTLPWFERLDAEGVIEAWLRSRDEDYQNRALEIMVGGVKERPDRIAQLLAPHAGHVERYPVWLRWIIRLANVHASRALFELVLAAVRRGEYDGRDQELFLSLYGLGKQQPAWAVDLLGAFLIERPGSLTLDSSGRVAALASHEHGAIELVNDAAAGSPRRFCERLVPYLLRVMALTAFEREPVPRPDRQFMHRGLKQPQSYYELDDALLGSAVGALRRFVVQDSAGARPLLEQLDADQHETAQWLLYEALIAAGEDQAEYAATLLLDRATGLCATNSPWTVRQLVEVISPHLYDESFARLESAIMAFRVSWESRPSGRHSFTLLSAMDEERLSPQGQRRLGELRRLFDTEQPSEPEEVTGGVIGSPIPAEAAQHMTDTQWLKAMERYSEAFRKLSYS
jgi:hypothetical protein